MTDDQHHNRRPPVQPRPGRQALQEGQISQLFVADIESGQLTLILECDQLIESPNWTPDGRWLVVNGGGRLYRVSTHGVARLEEIPTGDVTHWSR